MFNKLIQKLYLKQVQKNQKKQKVQLTKKQTELYKHFKDLYEFVKWINTKFSNRKEKKAFWRNVDHGNPVMETTLKNLIAQYELKDKK